MFKLINRIIGLVLLLVISIHVFAYGSILYYRAFFPHQTTFMHLRMQQLTEEGVNFQYQPVAYNNVSNNLKKALIASEDAKFTSHDGFDWDGIQQAIKKNQKSGRIKAGGSTITQQLAKNLLLWEERSYLRKGEEAILTFMIESQISKERIFSLYLNVIEWGSGIYGAQAASQHYYNKPVEKLTKQEAAKLAAMVPNPIFYQQNFNNRRLNNKTQIILKRMGSSHVPEKPEKEQQ